MCARVFVCVHCIGFYNADGQNESRRKLLKWERRNGEDERGRGCREAGSPVSQKLKLLQKDSFTKTEGGSEGGGKRID